MRELRPLFLLLGTTMRNIDRILSKLIDDDVSIATFRVISWLTVSSFFVCLIGIFYRLENTAALVLCIVLSLILVTQSFFYGFKNIALPIAESIFEELDYKAVQSSLQKLKRPHRFKVIGKLLIKRPAPALGLAAIYVGYFYLINELFELILITSITTLNPNLVQFIEQASQNN